MKGGDQDSPEPDLKDIYWGMPDFMWLQCLGLIIVMAISLQQVSSADDDTPSSASLRPA